MPVSSYLHQEKYRKDKLEKIMLVINNGLVGTRQQGMKVTSQYIFLHNLYFQELLNGLNIQKIKLKY